MDYSDIIVKHTKEIFDIKGVVSFGVKKKHLSVGILKEYEKNKMLVPEFIEGIPVAVRLVDPIVAL